MVKKKRFWWITAGIVVALLIAVGVVARGRGHKPMAVQTAKVDRQKIVQKVSATGKIQPKTKVDISADVSGKIEKLAVVEGQWVEKGAFLIGLARDRYVAAVESAVANVSATRANAALVQENLKRTKSEFERSKELLANGNESKAAFEAKQAEYLVEVARYKAAQDQVAQATAALKQARDDLSKTTIYAPMAGTVSALNKEQGEIALGSQFQKDVILVIGDLTQMEAQVNVDENDVGSIAIGQQAEIQVDALQDRTLNGLVTEISNSANTSGNGTTEQKTEFAIKISITDPPKELRPGMTASAEVITKTETSALSVPIQSVAVRTIDQLAMKGEKRTDAEKRYKADKDGFAEIVFCVVGGKAMAKQVKTGIQSETLIQILDGLEEGDEVVIGSYRAISKDLVNGAMVTISKEPLKEKGEDQGAKPG
jgi:HlyD family secretion protein